MSIKHSIVRPVMILAFAIFSGGLLLSATIIVASHRTNAGALDALNITLETQKLSNEMQHAQEYLNKILDMTRFIDADLLQQDLLDHTVHIHDRLDTISASELPPELSQLVTKLRIEFVRWDYLLKQRLGLTSIPNIPTRHVLDVQAQTVVAATHTLAAASAEYVQDTIYKARFQVIGIFGIAMIATLIVLGTAVIFAFKSASQMSQAVLRIYSRLLALARSDTSKVDSISNELEAVHAALNHLDEALREKRRMEMTLREEKARAEAATQTKSRFLATMSHEIRTPINGVLGMAEILHDSPLTTEQRSYSETILASSEALLRIVNDILDFSKLEAGKAVLIEQPFNLRDVVFDVATLVAPIASGKGVEVCIDVPEDTPSLFIGDNGRIRQVLMNLIGNAVKFTTKGHVGVEVSYDPKLNLPLKIKIIDTGVGIPAEQLGHIFQAFEQVESTTARRFEGTGLGLAISNHLTEAMKGKITATSALGEGSCFTLNLALPLAPGAREPNQRLAKHRADLVGKSVLLISELPYATDLRKRLLQSWGMDVHCVDGCKGAYARLAEGDCNVDVVLTETGADAEAAERFASALWERNHGTRIPVVFATDAQYLNALQSLQDKGPLTALMKPARNSALMQALLTALYPERATATQTTKTPKQSEDLSQFNVLIAEDNRTNQLVLRKMLGPTGLQMTFCNDGQAAVDAYRTGYFDLVLMDMSMPIMDGVQATKLIRKFERDDELSPCPIVALTANVMDTDEEACRAAGMVDFLTKPVRRQIVIDAIVKWTRRDDALDVINL